MRGRQREPDLEGLKRLGWWVGWHRLCPVPDAAARRHPLNAALADHIHLPRRGFVPDVKGQRVGQRGDAGVRVKPEIRPIAPRRFHIIQKNKRLGQLSDVTRAHQPCDRAVAPPGGAGGERS